MSDRWLQAGGRTASRIAPDPFLFAMVMDRQTGEVSQESLWKMTFAEAIVICSESREQVEQNLERWRYAL